MASLACPSCNGLYKDILDHIRKKHPADQYTDQQLLPLGLVACPTCQTACRGQHGIHTHQAKIHGIQGNSRISTLPRPQLATPTNPSQQELGSGSGSGAGLGARSGLGSGLGSGSRSRLGSSYWATPVAPSSPSRPRPRALSSPESNLNRSSIVFESPIEPSSPTEPTSPLEPLSPLDPSQKSPLGLGQLAGHKRPARTPSPDLEPAQQRLRIASFSSYSSYNSYSSPSSLRTPD
jgi:uncharacterized C2H2 Zn-finger protein